MDTVEFQSNDEGTTVTMTKNDGKGIINVRFVYLLASTET